MAIKKKPARVLNARPDTLDFRDRMYVANLYEVPTQMTLASYKARFGNGKPLILDQGQEGACTGFGLAAVANALLSWRKVVPDSVPVSARMLYEMAKRHDEWPGEKYDGSSARGAMKGWHKHGVCSETEWPYAAKKTKSDSLNTKRANDGLRRPLGAYYRVNHKDLVAMHAAMAEVGVLYATATVHRGWDEVAADGSIPYPRPATGGHAFAIVGYDQRGFWIQNSWAEDWGLGGFARISYDDWLANAADVWVARLGAAVVLTQPASAAIAHSAAARRSAAYSYTDLRPHIVSIGNNGLFRPGGDYGTSKAEVEALFASEIPGKLATWTGDKHLLLYAHGGLVGEETAVQRLADYRETMLGKQIYPVSFIWHTDIWTTFKNLLEDVVRRRRPEGVLDSAKDFMLNRFDDALEPLARSLGGRLAWKEMQQNALAASSDKEGGANVVAKLVGQLATATPKLKVHLVGHSAGSIFLAPMAARLAKAGVTVETCTMWAPACTTKLFDDTYAPAIDSGSIAKFALFTLTDEAEQDDSCAGIYNKSLLYLVSNAFEEKPRIPIFRDGEPLLGMEKFANNHDRLKKLIGKGKVDWIKSPNTGTPGSPNHSTAREHGAFDDDKPTLLATMARILKKGQGGETFAIHRSAASMQERRMRLAQS